MGTVFLNIQRLPLSCSSCFKIDGLSFRCPPFEAFPLTDDVTMLSLVICCRFCGFFDSSSTCQNFRQAGGSHGLAPRLAPFGGPAEWGFARKSKFFRRAVPLSSWHCRSIETTRSEIQRCTFAAVPDGYCNFAAGSICLASPFQMCFVRAFIVVGLLASPNCIIASCLPLACHPTDRFTTDCASRMHINCRSCARGRAPGFPGFRVPECQGTLFPGTPGHPSV